MFFAKAGVYDACGIFTLEHLILIVITVIGVIFALKKTMYKEKEEVSKIIKKCTIIVWIFEVIIIAFKIINDGYENINNYVPLYFCSLLLYAGLLSSFTKGTLKRVGDIFLATGGLIGGLVFIILPITSLLTYPMLHLVSIHSFIYHGIMIYLGILVNITNYLEIEWKDIIYYASSVGIICVLALIINNKFGSNLMFISQNFPGMPIEIIYKLTGKYFTVVMCVAQMILPFIFGKWGGSLLTLNKVEIEENKEYVGIES